MTSRVRSKQIYDASCALIPGGVNSPVRAFPGLEMTPLVVDYGAGDTIWDVDGKSYIDFCGSWGALILGHAPPKVAKVAAEQIHRGSSFGIMTEIEQKLAAKLIEHVPSLERVRFVSSGTEATMSAIRLARGYTERPFIVKFNGNYHGHVDSLLIAAGSGTLHMNEEASSKGVPKETIRHTVSLPFNDVDGVRAFLRSGKEIAAVLIEPIAGNMGLVPASREFLEMLREETRKISALLIFDEVISGFRVGLQGAQGLYGITPDLSCFGKVVGGGFPVAAFGGRKEIMNHLAPLGQVYQAGTLSGNPVAMCAGLQTLLEIEKPGFYEDLQNKTDRLTKPIQEELKKSNFPALLQQVGSMFTLFFGVTKVSSKEDLQKMDQTLYKRFFVHLFEKGIYFPPSPYETCFVSQAHTEENLEKTKEAVLEFIR